MTTQESIINKIKETIDLNNIHTIHISSIDTNDNTVFIDVSIDEVNSERILTITTKKYSEE